jgi:hypothetical protein
MKLIKDDIFPYGLGFIINNETDDEEPVLELDCRKNKHWKMLSQGVLGLNNIPIVKMCLKAKQ